MNSSAAEWPPVWKADEKQVALLRRTIRVGACASIAIGGAVLAMWVIGSRVPQIAACPLFEMKANTALGLVVAGLGIRAALRKADGWTAAAGCLVLLLGAATLVEYATARDLGIDNLILADFYGAADPNPGRMSPSSAVNFACSGLLLILAATGGWRRIWSVAAMELLGYLVFALGTAGLVGWVEKVAFAVTWGSQTRMAPHSAIAFMLLGAGLTALVWLGQNTRIARIPLWIPAALCLAILVIDLGMPFGVAAGVGYAPLVLCGLWFLRRHVTFVLAMLASLLIGFGFLESQPGGVPVWMDVANRALSVFAVWLAAAIVHIGQRSELAFLGSESRLHSVVSHAPDGLITIDRRGIIESANPACERIFGYQAGEMIGHNVKILMPEPYHSLHDDHIARYLATGEARIIDTVGREVLGRRKDGSTFPMDLSVSSFHLPDGRHFSGILRDITARKEAHADLVRHTEALERSNRELDDFAYIASHDLKEPLRGLSHNAQFLKEDYADKLDATGVRRLQRLQFLSQRLDRLISDLLYFSRLGRLELAIGPTDLNEVIHDIVLMMEMTLHEENATVRIEGTLPTVVCDSARVTEAFRNLITNAVKYNTCAQKRVEIGCLAEKASPEGLERQVFYVRDNGIGIKQQFFEDIFRMFKRLNSEEDDRRGEGVGLTFVRKIISRHGGRIWLESTPDEGSTFYFTLREREARLAA